MASAVAVLPAMAGRVPAIRVCALSAIGAQVLVLGLLPANAQMDQRTQARMQHLHHSLVIAEENLSLALRDADAPRVLLVNELLSNLASATKESKTVANRCLDAMETLGGATVMAAFAVHPATKGDLGSMTRQDLRFSEQMRPAASLVEKQFSESSASYRVKMPECEEEIGVGKTRRSLPEKLSKN
ncbi:MAG: hypothetical protein ACTHM2_13020 [Afipia sp.]